MTAYISGYFKYWGSFKNTRAEYVIDNSMGIETTESITAGSMQVSSNTTKG